MRLNSDIRNTIVNRAVAHALAVEKEAYEKTRTTFADKLYAQHYGEHEAAARALPSGWVEHEGHLAVHHPDFGHGYRGRHEGKCESYFTMSESRPVASDHESIHIGKKHPLYDELRAIAKVDQNIRTREEKMREKTIALVRSFQTTERLFEAWPEGEQFMPKSDAEQRIAKNKAMVPEDLAKAVNALLGIGQ